MRRLDEHCALGALDPEVEGTLLNLSNDQLLDYKLHTFSYLDHDTTAPILAITSDEDLLDSIPYHEMYLLQLALAVEPNLLERFLEWLKMHRLMKYLQKDSHDEYSPSEPIKFTNCHEREWYSLPYSTARNEHSPILNEQDCINDEVIGYSFGFQNHHSAHPCIVFHFKIAVLDRSYYEYLSLRHVLWVYAIRLYDPKVVDDFIQWATPGRPRHPAKSKLADVHHAAHGDDDSPSQL